LLRNCVRDFLDGYPFSEKQRLLMVLGVDEACTTLSDTLTACATIKSSRCEWRGCANVWYAIT